MKETTINAIFRFGNKNQIHRHRMEKTCYVWYGTCEKALKNACQQHNLVAKGGSCNWLVYIFVQYTNKNIFLAA